MEIMENREDRGDRENRENREDREDKEDKEDKEEYYMGTRMALAIEPIPLNKRRHKVSSNKPLSYRLNPSYVSSAIRSEECV